MKEDEQVRGNPQSRQVDSLVKLQAKRWRNINDSSGIINNIPALVRGILEDSYSGKASPRRAIKAKCLECVNYEDARNRIAECKTYRCPIWCYRPYTGDKS